MLKINGHELEFDLFDLESAQVYEKALAGVTKVIDEKIMDDSVFLSQSIILQCDAVRTFFDDMFGEGVGISVCGETYHLTKHLDAFDALISEAIRQRKEFDERGRRYTEELGTALPVQSE